MITKKAFRIIQESDKQAWKSVISFRALTTPEILFAYTYCLLPTKYKRNLKGRGFILYPTESADSRPAPSPAADRRRLGQSGAEQQPQPAAQAWEGRLQVSAPPVSHWKTVLFA